MLDTKDPNQRSPDRLHIHLDRAEAEALLPLLQPHAGKGDLRYVRSRIQSALQPPSYRWAVPSVEAAAADAYQEVEDYWGSASTREAARDAIDRLGAALRQAGVSIPSYATHWRGGLLNLLWNAGFTLHTDTREFRLLMETDPDQWHPSGPTLREVVDAWRAGPHRPGGVA